MLETCTHLFRSFFALVLNTHQKAVNHSVICVLLLFLSTQGMFVKHSVTQTEMKSLYHALLLYVCTSYMQLNQSKHQTKKKKVKTVISVVYLEQHLALICIVYSLSIVKLILHNFNLYHINDMKLYQYK